VSGKAKIRLAWLVRHRCRRVPALRSSSAGFRFPHAFESVISFRSRSSDTQLPPSIGVRLSPDRRCQPSGVTPQGGQDRVLIRQG
jgi:hypothetical protein